MKRLVLLFPLVVALVVPATADDPKDPSWKVVTFSVTKPEEPNPNAKSGPPRGNVGTKVVARLQVPGRTLVKFDAKKSKLDSFTDDKNTDLLAVPDGTRERNPLNLDRGFAPRPDEVTFQAPACPALGATKVRIKGTIVAVVGKDEKEVEKKDVDFSKGVELDFGTLKASNAGAAAGFAPPGLSYQGDKALKSITLVDADGKAIASRFTSRSPFGPTGKNGEYSSTVTINAKGVDRGTVRIKYFDSTEEITVPVDLEVGPGF